MKSCTQTQKGSPSRDLFKQLHKVYMPGHCYALDVDLELVEKTPFKFIVARLDFKRGKDDGLTFPEAISYDLSLNSPPPYGAPVYLVYGNTAFWQDACQKEESLRHPEQHRFTVEKLLWANYKPDPVEYDTRLVLNDATWQALSQWECDLRVYRRQQVAASQRR